MDKVTGFDIPADNVKRAAKFYEKVFGWEVSSHDKGHSHLMTVKMDKNWVPEEKGAINGGLFKRAKKKDSPLIVVEVDSIDERVLMAKKANGRVITPKTEAGEWGWWAEIEDTEGNVFELWENNM
jgi:predicted enzyme related to lactoylglutathione lyase